MKKKSKNNMLKTNLLYQLIMMRCSRIPSLCLLNLYLLAFLCNHQEDKHLLNKLKDLEEIKSYKIF
jgi:hypothetical protein